MIQKLVVGSDTQIFKKQKMHFQQLSINVLCMYIGLGNIQINLEYYQNRTESCLDKKEINQSIISLLPPPRSMVHSTIPYAAPPAILL